MENKISLAIFFNIIIMTTIIKTNRYMKKRHIYFNNNEEK
jgi:hypothetical protein